MTDIETKKEISYCEWIDCVRLSCKKGYHSKAFEILLCSEPRIESISFDANIYNELAKLETLLIKSSVESFQNAVNASLDELDLHIIEKELKGLKRALKDYLFFDRISISGDIKKRLKIQMAANLSAFFNDFYRYIHHLDMYSGNSFLDEFLYVYNKEKIKKYIQELLNE